MATVPSQEDLAEFAARQVLGQLEPIRLRRRTWAMTRNIPQAQTMPLHHMASATTLKTTARNATSASWMTVCTVNITKSCTDITMRESLDDAKLTGDPAKKVY